MHGATVHAPHVTLGARFGGALLTAFTDLDGVFIKMSIFARGRVGIYCSPASCLPDVARSLRGMEMDEPWCLCIGT